MHTVQHRLLLGLMTLAAFAATGPLALAQAPAPATSAVPVAAPAAPASAPAPAIDEAASYSVGLSFGSQLHGSGIGERLAPDAVMRGLQDGLAGKALSSEDRERTMQLVKSGREAAAARNRAAASAFLVENSTAKDVVTTASGLQYMIIEPGDAKAAAPTLDNRVTVRYRGRLLDGTEFDSSDKHAQAATFGLSGVIKGWREALLMMKPGAHWRLFVPPELAYDTNSPPAIPPGSLLVFEVELLRVEPPVVMGAQEKKPPGVKPPAAKAPPAKPTAP